MDDAFTLEDLSRYRLRRAYETLESARRDLNAGDYPSASNRAYYCIFHTIRAVNALDNEDFKKHSAVISYFTKTYLKPEIIPRKYGQLISVASFIRNRSDYEDFFTCNLHDAQLLFDGAKEFLEYIDEYLDGRYKSE